MRLSLPISRGRAAEKPVFIPTKVKAVRATVRISDLDPAINIPSDRVTNLASLPHSMNELQRSRVLQNALKSGFVVEAKEELL